MVRFWSILWCLDVGLGAFPFFAVRFSQNFPFDNSSPGVIIMSSLVLRDQARVAPAIRKFFEIPGPPAGTGKVLVRRPACRCPGQTASFPQHFGKFNEIDALTLPWPKKANFNKLKLATT